MDGSDDVSYNLDPVEGESVDSVSPAEADWVAVASIPGVVLPPVGDAEWPAEGGPEIAQANEGQDSPIQAPLPPAQELPIQAPLPRALAYPAEGVPAAVEQQGQIQQPQQPRIVWSDGLNDLSDTDMGWELEESDEEPVVKTQLVPEVITLSDSDEEDVSAVQHQKRARAEAESGLVSLEDSPVPSDMDVPEPFPSDDDEAMDFEEPEGSSSVQISTSDSSDSDLTVSMNTETSDSLEQPGAAVGTRGASVIFGDFLRHFVVVYPRPEGVTQEEHEAAILQLACEQMERLGFPLP